MDTYDHLYDPSEEKDHGLQEDELSTQEEDAENDAPMLSNIDKQRSLFHSGLDEIRKGLEGFYDGIPLTNMPRLSDLLGGIQRERYDLIGGNTGTGKTAFVDMVYVLGPLDYIFNNPEENIQLNINYFSMEIRKARKIVKLMALKLFLDYGLVIDIKQLLSYNKKRLKDDTYGAIMATEAFFDRMQDHLTIYEGAQTPISIKTRLTDYTKKYGKTTYVSLDTGQELDVDWNVIKKRPDHGVWRKKYYLSNPNLITEDIFDHIGLTQPNAKKTIDELSAYCVGFRNTYLHSPVLVSQLNRDIANIDRRTKVELTPALEDFKETGNTQEDADTVMVPFDPLRYNLQTYKGYPVARMANRYRCGFVLKNRNGGIGFINMRFIGENGHFCEIPYIPSEMTADEREEVLNSVLNLNRTNFG